MEGRCEAARGWFFFFFFFLFIIIAVTLSTLILSTPRNAHAILLAGIRPAFGAVMIALKAR